MKTYPPGDIRNFAIVGHAASGKTMLSEAMLACSGVINRMGSIAAGNTVSDYHDDEKERQISIHTSLMHTEWLGKKFNVIDTPGYLDFISEDWGVARGRFCPGRHSWPITGSASGRIRSGNTRRSSTFPK
jgi:elongation factor G